MTELLIAILGSGYMGRSYAECLTKFNTRVRLTAISGGRRAPGLAADYGVDHEPTYAGLLARPDVDAVLIATPHADHRDQVIEAAGHGKHVLVEKPMATSVADCDAMIAACRSAGVVLEVIQTLRFRGTPARAKQLIDAGRIGAVRMIRGQALVREYAITAGSWAGKPEHGGAFLDMGVHNFDIMRFWSGAEARRVFAHITTYGDSGDAWLSAMAQVVFTSGAMAQQWTSYEVPAQSLTGSQHQYVVVGETAALLIDGYGKLLLSTPDGTELIWEQPPIDFVNRPLDPVRLEAFYTQVQAFVDDVLDERAPTVPGEEGRAAVAIVEAAMRSAETGQAVEMVRDEG
jgi:predicted dehydrogenase